MLVGYFDRDQGTHGPSRRLQLIAVVALTGGYHHFWVFLRITVSSDATSLARRMETSKSPLPPVVVPSAEEDRATARRRRQRRRHLRSSVYFVSVAALFGGVCLVIAVRNAAQVTALRQRLERLERLGEEGDAAVDGAPSESVSTTGTAGGA